ncbi:MAG: histidine phosphatase family protein [Ethanoligenens sp.]|uniref:histidine phosphatase family protein n=1 Tax=Ethanoligenens sp. TaxID=2099655 RepID=UPI0039ED2EF5
MKAYHLYLIRHGMTQGNDEGRYIGATDQPLSKRGEEELKKLAQNADYPYADVFFTSPLQRCVRTLEILYPGAKPQVVPDLRECNFGAYENKSMEDLKDDPSYQAWVAAKGKSTPPDGEPVESFQKRCCTAFAGIVDQLLRTGSTHAVVCAHGGTIMFILAAFGYPNRPFYHWMTGNGQGYEIVITPQLWMSAQAFDIAAPIPENAPQNNLAGLRGVMDAFEDNRQE